jgi:hypothetical protein
MTYYRGQQVVCVTDYGGCAAYACPVKGNVYTIAELLDDPDLTGRQLWRRGERIPTSWLDQTMEHGKLWLRLEELPREPNLFRAFAFGR